MSNTTAIIAFLALTALGVGFIGAATHFVLAVIFGLPVSWGQSIGIGVVLSLIFNAGNR